jgi:hypothetical protein
MKLLLLLSILLSTNFLYAQNITYRIYVGTNLGIINTGENPTINYSPSKAFEQRFEEVDKKMETIINENQQIKAQFEALQKKEKQDFAKLQAQINAVVKDNANLQKNQELLAEQIKNIAQANTERQKLVATLPQNTTQELSTQLTQIATQIADVKKLTTDYKNDLETVQDKQGNTQIVLSLEKLKNDPRYSLIGDFSDGLATAKFGTKYGYIDQNYKTVIDYQYDEALPFSYGMAAVKTLSGWKYIDKQNNIVQKLENINKVSSFTSQFDLHNGNSVFDKEKKQIVLKFQEIVAYNNTLIRVKENQLYNFMNAQLKLISAKWFTKVSDFDTNGSTIADNALINKEGVIVVPTDKYQKITSTQIEKKTYYYYQENDKYGLLDHNGQVIVKAIHNNLSFDKYGYAVVKIDSFNYIHHYTTGLIIETKTKNKVEKIHSISLLEKQFGYALYSSFYHGLILKDGKLLYQTNEDYSFCHPHPQKYKNFYFFSNGNDEIKANTCFSKEGKLLWEFDHIVLTIDTVFKNGMTKIYGKKITYDNKVEKTEGIIGENGKLLLSPSSYYPYSAPAVAYIGDFQPCGLAIIGTPYGLVDKNLNIVVKPTYDAIDVFIGDYALAKKYSYAYPAGNIYILIDKKGKEVFTTKYEIIPFTDKDFTSNNIIMIKEFNKYAICKLSNKEQVTKFDYDAIGAFIQDVSIVHKKSNEYLDDIEYSHFGLLNTHGNEIVPCIFEEIIRIDDKKLRIRHRGETYEVDNSGACLTNCEKYKAILAEVYQKK